MFRLRQKGHLRYANVVATLALFISLGGASYAAVSLPGNSVGSRQLRAGSVTRKALGFPLSVASVTDKRTEDILGGTCNGWPLLPGEPAPPCVSRRHGGPTPGRELKIHLPSRGQVVVSVIVGLTNKGTPGTHATVTAEIVLDRRVAKEAAVVLDGGQTVQVPTQETFLLPPGTHTIGVSYGAKYSARGPDVFVGPISVVAIALPRD